MKMNSIKKIKIIAEAGVNHNGDISIAKELVDIAYDAGADIVKFQTFKADDLVTRTAKMADYQKTNTGKIDSQFDLLKRLELKYEYHHELKQYAQKLGIEFLSTAFDKNSLDFLVQEIVMHRLKIPSGDITNGPLILQHALTKLPIILSTGMSDLVDIEQALKIICYGYLTDTNSSSSFNDEDMQELYLSEQGKKIISQKVTILQCNTEYPTPLEDVNLAAMDTIRNKFNTSVGYSDHTLGIDASLYAAARGAAVIEKHFTISRDMKGPDHMASIEPEELKIMIQKIRQIEVINGEQEKVPSSSEIKNKAIARKSIIAARKIKKGSIIEPSDLVIKRPGSGLSPMKYWETLGTQAMKDYEEEEIF